MSIPLLELAASRLGELTDELVFVGGATITLWITEPAAPATRATDDVDVICDVTGYGRYHALSERLRAHGFAEDVESGVLCRWRHVDGVTLDVMPSDEAILGFSNRWYPRALETARERTLPSGLSIRTVSPPLVVATKLEAWHGRGRGDVLRSFDVHDIVALVDGRPELADEVASERDDVRDAVRDGLAGLLSVAHVDYVIAGAVAGYGAAAVSRAEIVLARLERLAGG